MNIFSWLTTLAGLYGFIKIIIDMIIGKSWKEICKSHEFITLIVAIILTFIILFPWSKIHWGSENKIVIRDTIRDTIHPVMIQKNTGGNNSMGNNNNTGKNNFNGGTGNKYNAPVHVGDNIYEPQLLKQDRGKILSIIQNLKFKHNIKGHNILLWLNNSSNLRTYCQQLNDYLVSKGYTVTISSGYDTFNGIKITPGSPNGEVINYEMFVGSKESHKSFPIILVDTLK